MKKLFLHSLVLAILTTFSQKIIAQCDQLSGIDVQGRKCGGAVQSAVPFLIINPDARSGGMGDAGIAISTDANAMHFNASKLANTDQKWGGSISYTPWLRNLNVNDIYLAYASGFYQFGEKGVKQTVGLSLTYFSLGELTWTGYSGEVLGYGAPREYSVAAAYARQLSPELSIGFTGKYIYSNLASGQSVGGTGNGTIRSGQAVAADLSFTYKKPLKSASGKGDLTIAAVISNIGNKVNYLNTADYLPANLGIGAAFNKPFDPLNRIVFTVDLNKLLVPTPQPLATDPTRSWKQQGLIGSIINSFSDAPGGFSEELAEINVSAGAEYWYDNQFAFRAGYFYEDKAKGGRQYLTVGIGLKYSVMGINISYLVPTSSQRGPLDNTLRFSLLFDAATFKNAEAAPSDNN